MADPGETSPLLFFVETAPPLSQGLDDLPPPPFPYLKVWISRCRPRFHLTLHCITAIPKSPKSLVIVTGKGKADNRVDSTVCVSHKHGDIIRYPKLTIQSVFWYKIKCYYLNGKGYPANEKRYNDSNCHLEHFSVSSCSLFLSVG